MTDAAPAEHLTLFEPLASAVNWVEIVGVHEGDTVVVEGPGHQGLAVLEAVLAKRPSQVVVTGTSQDGLRLDPVCDVDDLGLRRDPLDHPVAGADEVVLQSEVGQERDEHGRRLPGLADGRDDRVERRRHGLGGDDEAGGASNGGRLRADADDRHPELERSERARSRR